MFQKGPIVNDNYIDQVRQSKNVLEIEGSNILEPGEVIVVCLDKVREIKKSNIEGKIVISNYRVICSFNKSLIVTLHRQFSAWQT